MPNTVLKDIHDYLEIISTAVSYIVNFVMIYLVIMKTPKELKPYVRILFGTCAGDLFFTTILLITKECMELNNGLFVLIIARFQAGNWNFYLSMLWVFGLWMGILSLPVPFFYRYLLMCREHLLSNLEFLLVYSIPVLFSIGFTILCGFCWYPSVEKPNKFVHVVDNDYWRNPDGSLPSFIAANVSDAVTLIMLIIAGLFVSMLYVLILYFNAKIWTKLKTMQAKMTSKNHRLQKQLSYTLLAQIFAPLILAFIPVMFVVIFLFLRIPATGFGLIFNMTTGWLPVVNATSTIALVGPYRDTITCRRLRRGNKIGTTKSRGSVNANDPNLHVSTLQSAARRQEGGSMIALASIA